MSSEKKLTLGDGKWLGVCAGLADYLEIDVTVVRLVVVLCSLLGGGFGGLIIYWIAWMVIPKN
jgi:phage shock protein PspC (stress-responsive transcriptional regulator)